jgi:hypothetical protein
MPRIGRPSTLTGPIAELAEKLGGVRFLAAELNVDTRTVRYWARNDRKPSGPARKLLENLSSIHGIKVTVESHHEVSREI